MIEKGSTLKSSLAQATSTVPPSIHLSHYVFHGTLQSDLCAHCHKDTTNVCTGCNWTLNTSEEEATKTYYCSDTCQRGDWANHKAACKAIQERRSLYRAGSTIQTLFYKFRERLFEQLIVKVERKGDIMYLQEGYYTSLLVPFPANLFADEEERNAVLAWLACNESVDLMHEVIKTMLKGLCSNIMEVALKAKNKRRQLIKIDVLGTENCDDCRHVVLSVTFRCGKRYALDISGAQYGYYEPVIPWDLYVNTRVGSILEFFEFGEWQSRMRPESSLDGTTYDECIMWLNNKAAMVLNAALVDWQKEERTIPFNTMLKLSEDAFHQRQSEFIKFIEWDLPTQEEMAKWYNSVSIDEGLPEMTEATDECLPMI